MTATSAAGYSGDGENHVVPGDLPPPLGLSGDDLVGILIHRANQMVAVLGQRGLAADFNAIQHHLSGMFDVAARCHGYQQSVVAAHAQSGVPGSGDAMGDSDGGTGSSAPGPRPN